MKTNILVSSDNSYFREYWPHVKNAWNKFFPEYTVYHVMVEDVDKHCIQGDEILIPSIDGYPKSTQAKMARHLAATLVSGINMVEDIDTVPLQRKFVENIIKDVEEDSLLCVGKNVYRGTEHYGKFPISNMCTSQRLWKTLMFGMYSGDDFEQNIKDFYNKWRDVKVFDHKEKLISSDFSDESLMRVLICSSGIKTKDIDRNVDIHLDWIDRSWWKVDYNKLYSGGYVLCNFLRPPSQHMQQLRTIYDFLNAQ